MRTVFAALVAMATTSVWILLFAPATILQVLA